MGNLLWERFIIGNGDAAAVCRGLSWQFYDRKCHETAERHSYMKKQKSRKTLILWKNPGSAVLWNGAYGIRTRDLHTASVARSQLRQCPMYSVYHIFGKKQSENVFRHSSLLTKYSALILNIVLNFSDILCRLKLSNYKWKLLHFARSYRERM